MHRDVKEAELGVASVNVLKSLADFFDAQNLVVLKGNHRAQRRGGKDVGVGEANSVEALLPALIYLHGEDNQMPPRIGAGEELRFTLRLGLVVAVILPRGAEHIERFIEPITVGVEFVAAQPGRCLLRPVRKGAALWPSFRHGFADQ
jgi:hypothetical protein